MMKQIELDENGWPVHLILPTKDDFVHGRWVKSPVHSDQLIANSATVSENCDTRCCLVGWSGLAFAGRWDNNPCRDDEMPGAQRTFLHAFLKNLPGYDEQALLKRFDSFSCNSFSDGPLHRRDDDQFLSFASFVFEGGDSPDERVAGMKPLSPKVAAATWRKTAAQFEYNVRGAQPV